MNRPTTYRQTWETYTRSWSEVDSAQRRRLLEQAVNPQCVYTDPHIEAQGHTALSDYMSEFQKNFRDSAFVVTDYSEHHRQSLAAWNLVDGRGAVLAHGTSFAAYDDNGLLLKMSGFFPPFAPASA